MGHKLNYSVFSLLLIFLMSMGSGVSAGTHVLADRTLDSADGHYVIYQKDGSARIISVDSDGVLKDTIYKAMPEGFVLSVTSSKGEYSFQVPLRPIQRPLWKYEQPQKVFVMSDPHGKLDCFISLLQGNGVIDESLNWNYGCNHLMIIGDVFDRGDDVTQILWLIYKLEQEASQAGGCVSFLLGNHEPMVLANDLRYCTPKYHSLAEKLGISYSALFGANTELGKWLVTRNTMQIIGKDLYVHAGLSKEFHEWNLSVPTVNEEMSKALFMSKKERKELSDLTAFLYGSSGPIWYRGMVRNEAKYNPLPADTLGRILERYDAKRIIVGHTIFEEVSTFYDKRVIDVNVNNAKNREKGLGRGLLIEGKKYMIVGDEGVQRVF